MSNEIEAIVLYYQGSIRDGDPGYPEAFAGSGQTFSVCVDTENRRVLAAIDESAEWIQRIKEKYGKSHLVTSARLADTSSSNNLYIKEAPDSGPHDPAGMIVLSKPELHPGSTEDCLVIVGRRMDIVRQSTVDRLPEVSFGIHGVRFEPDSTSAASAGYWQIKARMNKVQYQGITARDNGDMSLYKEKLAELTDICKEMMDQYGCKPMGYFIAPDMKPRQTVKNPHEPGKEKVVAYPFRLNNPPHGVLMNTIYDAYAGASEATGNDGSKYMALMIRCVRFIRSRRAGSDLRDAGNFAECVW